MTHTIQQVANEPIILIKIFSPFDAHNETSEILHEIIEMVYPMPGLTYLIYNVLELKLGFSDMVMGMAAALRSNVPGVEELKTKARMVVVGAGDLIKFAAKSAKQVQYGGLNVELFDTSEEALAFAREQLAKTS